MNNVDPRRRRIGLVCVATTPTNELITGQRPASVTASLTRHGGEMQMYKQKKASERGKKEKQKTKASFDHGRQPPARHGT